MSRSPAQRIFIAMALVAAQFSRDLPSDASIWPTAVDRAERQLRSPDPATRRGAAHRLGDLPRAAAERLLLAALDDPDPDVRVALAELATDWQVTEAAKRVVPWLGDPDRRLRVSAARLLAVAPTEQALAGLGRALGDPDAELRTLAATALSAAGEGATTILLGHLDDPVPRVRERVVAALGRIADPRSLVPLVGKIQDGQPAVRRAVARALGELGDVRAASALVLALRDSDEMVRLSAVDALGRLGAEEGATALAALMRSDTSEAVRRGAARSLARIHAPAAVDALVAVLDDPVLARSAEQGLLAQGQNALPRLEQCLRKSLPGQNATGCARVLGRLRTPGALSLIREVWQRGGVDTETALTALADLGDRAGLPWALEHLGDAEPRLRRAATEALGALLDPDHPDGRAVEPIQAAIGRPGIRVAERCALVALLGRTGSSAAVPLLRTLALPESDVRLRVVALEALGRIGPAGQDDVLFRALSDERPSVRLAAAVALRQSASAGAASLLLDRLARAAEQDRTAVALALAGALARVRDPALVLRTSKLIGRAREAERDQLIEALGRAPLVEACAELTRLAELESESATRAKIAEALGSHPEARVELVKLARDPDGSVRANAVWALGSVGSAQDLSVVETALRDPDAGVAANAAAALGRIAAREKLQGEAALCRALRDSRSHVRANALGALGLLGRRCDDRTARTLLARDPADVVRRAAAWLLSRVPSTDSRADALARLRCQDEDTSGEVAQACSEEATPLARATDAVTVYVVPVGEASPVPRAPFALIRSDGLARFGLADRRGVVFEHDAPRGRIKLGVPALSRE